MIHNPYPPATEEQLAAAMAAVRQSPEDPVLRIDLAHALLGLGRFDDALAEFREILQLPEADAGHHTHAYLYIGSLMLDLGNPEVAMDAFQMVLEYSPREPSALLELGNLHPAAGDLPAARHYWQALVDAWGSLENSYQVQEARRLLIEHDSRAPVQTRGPLTPIETSTLPLDRPDVTMVQ